MKGDEIALIGVAGRFPGAAEVEELWQNLLDGVDCAGKPVEGVEDFDAERFGFDPAEAARTDPQQRLFLETAWRAFEDAGYDPESLPSTMSTGVFASASANQYLLCNLLPHGTEPPPYQLPDYLPAQVAYRLGLTGPAMAVQTACSGSLVAVCQAAQSLADFRCDMAIAGGSNVALPQYRYDPALVSDDGCCRAFDAEGQGTGFATGTGAVILRRLADAEADGDRIYAVLRGWAVTNDGARRAGFAAPGIQGQSAAIAEALAVAELEPTDVGYIEAHGSGTVLGDAIEVAALRRVYTELDHRVWLGSIKTSIGHLDAASGVVGLIKAALAVQRAQVPANLHFAEPNPQIEFGPLAVPTATCEWPVSGERIAGVSAFGLGGTNAHVVLAQPASDQASRRAPLVPRRFQRQRCWIDPPGVAP